jgi:hypothetical protein
VVGATVERGPRPLVATRSLAVAGAPNVACSAGVMAVAAGGVPGAFVHLVVWGAVGAAAGCAYLLVVTIASVAGVVRAANTAPGAVAAALHSVFKGAAGAAAAEGSLMMVPSAAGAAVRMFMV